MIVRRRHKWGTERDTIQFDGTNAEEIAEWTGWRVTVKTSWKQRDGDGWIDCGFVEPADKTAETISRKRLAVDRGPWEDLLDVGMYVVYNPTPYDVFNYCREEWYQ